MDGPASNKTLYPEDEIISPQSEIFWVLLKHLTICMQFEIKLLFHLVQKSGVMKNPLGTRLYRCYKYGTFIPVLWT